MTWRNQRLSGRPKRRRHQVPDITYRCLICDAQVYEADKRPKLGSRVMHKIVTPDEIAIYCSDHCPGRLSECGCGHDHCRKVVARRAKKMDRRLYAAVWMAKKYQEREDAGLCRQCGGENDRAGKARMCSACRERDLAYKRAAGGWGEWKPGGRGRKPLTAVEHDLPDEAAGDRNVATP